MGAEVRRPDDPVTLLEQLTVKPPRTDFFTAVWLLERLSRGRPRVGEDGPFDEEALFFRHDPSFSFQPNDISEVRGEELERAPEQRLRGRHRRYEITTCVLGLTGADSPMPLYHAEDLVIAGEDAVPQRMFLDLFHNRLTSLFFRATSKYDYPHEFLAGARDVLSARALACAGVDVHAESADAGLARTDLLRLSALLALGGGTTRSIENSLAEVLAPALAGVPLKVEPFTGGWVTFDPSQRIALGRANSEIGETFVLGTRALHPADRARVIVGPMPPEQARDFSPGGSQFQRVRQLVAALCRDPISYDLELLVHEDAYPPFVIGSVARGRIGEGVVLTAKRTSGRLERKVFDLDRLPSTGMQ
jgi:type VI secretion system protein ImpH